MKAILIITALSILRALVAYVLLFVAAMLVRMDSSLAFGRIWSFFIELCLCVLWFSYSNWYFRRTRSLFCGQCFGRRVVMGSVVLVTLIVDAMFLLSACGVFYLCFTTIP